MNLSEENLSYNQGLFDFLDASPTPFHACENLLEYFVSAGYQHLKEEDTWAEINLSNTASNLSGCYVITRNDSSLVAINIPDVNLVETGINLVGAHTDSPCLKIKPNADTKNAHYLQCGVEVYGGVLLNTWFDRDLSLAGRVNYLDENNQQQSQLVNFSQAVGIVPSLAIHLDREANKNHTVNSQTDIPPILLNFDLNDLDYESLVSPERKSFDDVLLSQLNLDVNLKHKAVKILAHELSFYDHQQASYVGVNKDFICSGRLDNLLSCYIATQALLQSHPKKPSLVVFNDHEEVGSASTSGAQGNFLISVIKRLSALNVDESSASTIEESYYRILKKSQFISADNAHAIHPNFKQKHDQQHGPIINQGPVIKVNANQRYASNSETIANFKQVAEVANINYQQFVVRTDMGCGSTIGPIIASSTGIQTIDVGLPTFAMHSIRETAGSHDVLSLHNLLKQYFI